MYQYLRQTMLRRIRSRSLSEHVLLRLMSTRTGYVGKELDRKNSTRQKKTRKYRTENTEL